LGTGLRYLPIKGQLPSHHVLRIPGDTCTISALLDARHKNYSRVRRSEEAIEAGSLKYVSRFTLAEVSFGLALHSAATGSAHPVADRMLPVLKISPFSRSQGSPQTNTPNFGRTSR
jgi:hypothetical protein